MYCINCGQQLPDNAKFCNNCGAQQSPAANAARTPNTTTTQTTAKPVSKTKKSNPLLVGLVVVLAFLAGKHLLAPSMVSDSETATEPATQPSFTTAATIPVQVSNPAYDAIFDDTYIIHFQSFFNMEMSCFAMKQEDGMILCSDYGYENDIVKEWVETIYVPVSGYTDAEKAEMETYMKEQLASVEAISCCTVTYQMGANYLTITCTYSDVDQESSYSELYSLGLLTENTFISMSQTESNLLNQGFVKK